MRLVLVGGRFVRSLPPAAGIQAPGGHPRHLPRLLAAGDGGAGQVSPRSAPASAWPIDALLGQLGGGLLEVGEQTLQLGAKQRADYAEVLHDQLGAGVQANKLLIDP